MPDIENLLNIEDEVTQVLSDLGVNEKLNEMDDFMNQNDLKVQITNENAVVTGLVTYTCTVKDKNNTALANKVVEWYKGTTLIGIDATDSNGVSTFSHRVTEADIYDVHAIVRGTHAGDDIRMFVKDKDNVFIHQVWSGGEYLHSTTGFIKSNELSYSYSTDSGEPSIKAVVTGTGTGKWLRTDYAESPSNGSNLKLNVDIFSPNAAGTLRLIQVVDGTQTILNTVNFPANDDFETFEVEGVVASEEVSSIMCMITFTGTVNQMFYARNWGLKVY